MTDPRVTHLWDDGRELALWIPQQDEYADLVFGPLAWDIFFLYGPQATWDTIPAPVISSGSTIIARRGDLEKSILPLLPGG